MQAVGLRRSVENEVLTQTSIPYECRHWASHGVAFLRNAKTRLSTERYIPSGM
ncbi:MAG: hypothetical protein LBQ66_16170 [Planctomycetaceae bacterium]|nr:hypothetical protein [Planctomycetaceae bacterium]